MSKKDYKIKDNNNNEKEVRHGTDGRYDPFVSNSAIPGINTPGIELPAFNPPVPNRAWTAMRQGLEIEDLDEEDREALFEGREFD